MSVFDRDKARAVLQADWDMTHGFEWVLDQLSACVVPSAAEAKLARIEALHRPEESGMGYHEDGHYGSFEAPVCSTCGTADEYGVPWPCPTMRALQDDV